MIHPESFFSNIRAELAGTRIFPQTAPRHVYHYTTVDGLQGILNSNELWATDISFLNDASEYVYAEKLLNEVIAEMNPISHSLADLIRTLSVNPLSAINFYVACFCERADSLSQWRAYGNNGTGYALEIDTEFLTAVTSASEYALFGRIEYGAGRQKNLLRTLMSRLIPIVKTSLLHDLVNASIDRAVDEAREEGLSEVQAWRRVKREGATSDAWPIVESLVTVYGQITASRAFLKSKTFSEEREWRLAMPVSRFSDSKLRFRTKNGILVPYRGLDLRSSGRLPITRVIIGPTLHPRQARESLERFLSRADLANVEVVVSEIPLRL